MAPPLVSIVIPCYNQGRYLGEAIESARNQRHSNVEVMVVDDGSTDDAAPVAAAYQGIRYLHQQNSGTAVARNRGLSESRGEFVIFLDADDRLLPDAVARGVEYFGRHPDTAFVSGHVRLIDADGTPTGLQAPDHEPASYVALLRWNYIWTPGTVMYRRTVLDAIGTFDPSAGGSADYDLNIRIARRLAVACHHHPVLEYRQHDANMTRDSAHMLRSAVSVRRREKKFARGRGDTREAWRAGLKAVQADYGGQLITRIKADLIAGRWWPTARGLLCLLRYYPAGLAMMGAPREWPKLVTRRWRMTPR